MCVQRYQEIVWLWYFCSMLVSESLFVFIHLCQCKVFLNILYGYCFLLYIPDNFQFWDHATEQAYLPLVVDDCSMVHFVSWWDVLGSIQWDFHFGRMCLTQLRKYFGFGTAFLKYLKTFSLPLMSCIKWYVLEE